MGQHFWCIRLTSNNKFNSLIDAGAVRQNGNRGLIIQKSLVIWHFQNFLRNFVMSSEFGWHQYPRLPKSTFGLIATSWDSALPQKVRRGAKFITQVEKYKFLEPRDKFWVAILMKHIKLVHIEYKT